MSGWITSLMDSLGAVGVGLLMLAENLFPPIPSELVMPLAGYSATRAATAPGLALVAVVLAGSAGSLLGAVLWYWVGARIGLDRLKAFSRRHGRWLTLTPDDIDRADAWFDRHGGRAVFAGRLVPTVRTFISVPAGASGMPFRRFLAYTAAGTLIWTALLACAGWLLQSGYTRVSAWIGPVSTAVLIAIAAVYLYRVATFRAPRDDTRAGPSPPRRRPRGGHP